MNMRNMRLFWKIIKITWNIYYSTITKVIKCFPISKSTMKNGQNDRSWKIWFYVPFRYKNLPHIFKLRHYFQKNTAKMYNVLQNRIKNFNPLHGHITTGSFVKWAEHNLENSVIYSTNIDAYCWPVGQTLIDFGSEQDSNTKALGYGFLSLIQRNRQINKQIII